MANFDCVTPPEVTKDCVHSQSLELRISSKNHNILFAGTGLIAKNTDGTSVNGRLLKSIPGTLIVIVGHSDSGNSSLLKRLLNEVRDTSTVLWWDLFHHGHDTVNSLEQLSSLPLPDQCDVDLTCTDLAEELLRNEGRNTLLFIDHFTSSSSFLSQLLSKTILPYCSIIVAVQYTHVECLIADAPSYELFEMKGIKKDDVYDTVLRIGREMKLKSTDRMADYVCAYPELLQMCQRPARIQQVLEVYNNDNCQCPKTVTSLLKAMVEYETAYFSKEDFSITEKLKIIYHLAFESLDDKEFNRHEFSCLCTNLSISGSGEEFQGLGLMQLLIEKDHIKCKFIDEATQAYLASLHIRSKPIFEQAYLILKFADKIVSNNQYLTTLIYYCGTADTHMTTLNIEKITLYPLLESLADKLSLNDDSDGTKLSLFIRCLFEAQDPSAIRKFLSGRQCLLNIPLKEDGRMLDECKLSMVAYCIAHSGINSWMIEAVPEHTFLMDYFKMLIVNQLSADTKPHFKIKIVEGSSTQVSPIHPKEMSPAKPKSNVYLRIAREVFHRLLQLHSPIKLKSDGSNTSYISLLGCDCLQKSMEKEQILKLEPISSLHWLPLKSKTSKTLNQQVQTVLHMRQLHDDQHMEFVVMMVPFPHRLRFIAPVTKEEALIELCTNSSPDFLQSGVEDDFSFSLVNDTFEETSFNSSNGKIVLPSLPLPKQRSHSKTRTIAPDIPDLPRPNKHKKPSSNNEKFYLATPIPDSMHPWLESVDRREGQEIIHSRRRDPIGTQVSPIKFHGSRLEQSEHQPQLMRPSMMQAGIVVHTTIPDIFATDQQYPLPDETDLIRKGGNGEIFTGMFSGRELIIKKTSYRSRELQIHSKLQHRNIIPLLCLMTGEKHPTQRRKMTCYHFMPRANGDLAKLAVDHERNTLKQLKIDHGQNPKTFGLVHGNMKYVLTQVLRGLAYLHSQSIVHRDLKSSNILLTFHCSCFNPLMCACTNKCDVQIADFDSAIQLTKDRLLPSSRTTNRGKNIYTVVPVGTMGYRPPESGQLTISNDVSIISPHVTTKSDIWSFGVLMMKMLNGNYGPSSQREVSSLCLCYVNIFSLANVLLGFVR